MSLVYRTEKGVRILVTKGKKSQYDFKVQYKEYKKRRRTPKHIHLIIDLYLKLCRNKKLTMQLVDHIINNIILRVKSSTTFPPKLQILSKEYITKFEELNNYGEYPVEFLLVITELIMIQEKTNYPKGTMNLNLFQKFRNEEDIFSVVSAATFRGK